MCANRVSGIYRRRICQIRPREFFAVVCSENPFAHRRKPYGYDVSCTSSFFRLIHRVQRPGGKFGRRPRFGGAVIESQLPPAPLKPNMVSRRRSDDNPISHWFASQKWPHFDRIRVRLAYDL